jgi:hypothetical protein
MWQAGAVAVLFAAIAALTVPQVRTFLAPGPPPAKQTVITAPLPKQAADSRPMVVADSAEVLKKISSWVEPPKIPVTAPLPGAMADAAPIPQPPPPTTDWIYQGSMITEDSRSALVKVDNTQQILSLGGTFNDTKLVTIEPDYIEIERTGQPKKKIDIASRKADPLPNEPPRKPVAFKSPPAIAGTPGSMPGGPMAMGNTAHPGAVPPAQAFSDQARIAARDAMARGAAPQNPPQIPPADNNGVIEMNGQKYEQGPREEAIKYLSEPDLSPELRGKYL